MQPFVGAFTDDEQELLGNISGPHDLLQLPPRAADLATGAAALQPQYRNQQEASDAKASTGEFLVQGRLQDDIAAGTPPPVTACSRIPLYISLVLPSGGLCNMVYMLISGWTLAVELGADVLLPGVWHRQSFHKGGGWHPATYDSVFSHDATVETLSELGVRAAAAPSGLAARSNQTVLTLHLDTEKEVKGGHVLRYELSELVRIIKEAVFKAAAAEMAARASSDPGVPCLKPPVVHLHLHVRIFSLRTDGLPLAAHLARRLRFSALVERHAQHVISTMAAQGHAQYNGLHLRIEGDFNHMNIHSHGSLNATLRLYAELCRDMRGWDMRTPVLVASGLFTYLEGRTVFERSLALLAPCGTAAFLHKELFAHRQLELGSSSGAGDVDGSSSGGSDSGGAFFHDELLNGQQQLAVGNGSGAGGRAGGGGASSGEGIGGSSSVGAMSELHSEQLAAVDLLLMLRASHFIGAHTSSMSWFVVQRRLLGGAAPASMAMTGYNPKHSKPMHGVWEARAFSKACPVMQCV